MDNIGDGEAISWHARDALTHRLGVGEFVANWDGRKHRTQSERIALVDAVLEELGADKRRGGWSVSSGVVR